MTACGKGFCLRTESSYCRSEPPYCRSELPYCRSEPPYCRSEPPYCRSESPYCRSEPPYCRSEPPYCRTVTPYCGKVAKIRWILGFVKITFFLPSTNTPNRKPLDGGNNFQPQIKQNIWKSYGSTLPPYFRTKARCRGTEPPYLRENAEITGLGHLTTPASGNNPCNH